MLLDVFIICAYVFKASDLHGEVKLVTSAARNRFQVTAWFLLLQMLNHMAAFSHNFMEMAASSN